MTHGLKNAMLGLALLATAGLSDAQAQDEVTRDITNIAGDVYRFQNNFHYSVFMVTPDGVIATDPINADAATWLEAEIDKRFGLPIRYLVYSHDHADHIAGGEVFADTATVVAHENAKKRIIERQHPTALPDLTFSDRMTLSLGGKSVELIYLGQSHSDNLIVMRFPEERIVFAVDMVTVNRVPYRNFPDAYIEGWIEALKKLEALEYDILAPGHGAIGTPDDVAPHRQYIEQLYAQVSDHVGAGRSLDDTKRQVDMTAFKDWGRYDDWAPLNVEGMYEYLAK